MKQSDVHLGLHPEVPQQREEPRQTEPHLGEKQLIEVPLDFSG
jgi:hypothetical protein